MLLFVIPADSDDIMAEYRTLLKELEKFNPELLDKERIIGISKSDMLDSELRREIESQLPENTECVVFSSVSGENLQLLKDRIWNALNKGCHD